MSISGTGGDRFPALPDPSQESWLSWAASPVTTLWRGATRTFSAVGTLPNTAHQVHQITAGLAGTTDDVNRTIVHANYQLANANQHLGILTQAANRAIPQVTQQVAHVASATVATNKAATTFFERISQIVMSTAFAGTAMMGLKLYWDAERLHWEKTIRKIQKVPAVQRYWSINRLPTESTVHQIQKIAGLIIAVGAGLGWIYRMGKGILWGKTAEQIQQEKLQKQIESLSTKEWSQDELNVLKQSTPCFSTSVHYFGNTLLPTLKHYANQTQQQLTASVLSGYNQQFTNLTNNAFALFKDTKIENKQQYDHVLMLRKEFVAIVKQGQPGLSVEQEKIYLTEGLPVGYAPPSPLQQRHALDFEPTDSTVFLSFAEETQDDSANSEEG